MKALTLIGILALSLNAMAAPATTYVCVGTNEGTRDAIGFDLTFSDWTPDTSYTNESVTITRRGFEVLEKPIVLQMKGANAQNNCQANQFGEIYMNGDGFEMNPTNEGDIAPYQVSFTSKCGTDHQYSVKAYCFHE